MFKSIRNRYISSILIAGITLFTATACTTTNLVKGENDIRIERVDSKGATISHAYLSQSGDQLSLRGEVKRRGHGRGPIPGHLHVTLIDSQGQVIKEADISYIRRNVKSSIATFSTKLPIELASGSKVKITHFNTKTHKTYPEEAMWRDVQK